MSIEPGTETARESPALRTLGRVVSALAGAATAIAAVGLLIALGLIGWSVVLRYAFNAAPVWVDDVVSLILVAIVMLSAAQTLRRGEHIGVDLLVARLPCCWRRWAQVWAVLATMVIAGVLIVNGWQTAMLARMLGLLTEGSIELPTWWLMLLMPVGGALLLLAAIEALWRGLAGLPAHAEKTPE